MEATGTIHFKLRILGFCLALCNLSHLRGKLQQRKRRRLYQNHWHARGQATCHIGASFQIPFFTFAKCADYTAMCVPSYQWHLIESSGKCMSYLCIILLTQTCLLPADDFDSIAHVTKLHCFSPVACSLHFTYSHVE